MVLGVPVLAALLASLRPSLGPVSISVIMGIAALEAASTRQYVQLWRDPHITIEQSVRASPRFWRTRYIHGMSFVNSGRHKEGAEHLQASMALCDDFANTYFGLTQANMNEGKVTEAIEWMAAGAKKFPDNYLAHLNWGMLLQMENRHAEAVLVLEAAVAIDSSDPDGPNA